MSFAILRIQKMKQQAIKGIQFHNQRERESHTNPDIDQSRSHLNYDLVNPEFIDYNKKINKMIEDGVKTGKKVRKDAVRLTSIMVTSDRGFFDELSPGEQKRYFETSFEFLAEKYGRENLAYAVVHNDEKTPHMHVGFVPITEDGRLSAKDFFGKREQLFALQNEFHAHVTHHGFDLERGVSSERKNIETSRFKAITAKNDLLTAESELKNVKATLEKGIQYAKGLERMIKEKKVILDGQEESLKINDSKIAELKAELDEISAPLKVVNSIETKEKKSFLSKDVEVLVKKEDFENLKELAQKTVSTEKKNVALREENDGLKTENKRLWVRSEKDEQTINKLSSERAALKKENRNLLKENSILKKLQRASLEMFKELGFEEKARDVLEKLIKTLKKSKDNELER